MLSLQKPVPGCEIQTLYPSRLVRALVGVLGLKAQGRRPHLCTQEVLEIRVRGGMGFLFVCGELPLPEGNWRS